MKKVCKNKKPAEFKNRNSAGKRLKNGKNYFRIPASLRTDVIPRLSIVLIACVETRSLIHLFSSGIQNFFH
jgi:hypothetical protein